MGDCSKCKSGVVSVHEGETACDCGGRDAAVKYDKGKPQWALLPFDALSEVARVYTKGAEKYAPRNWEKGMAYSRILSSTLRHLTSWYQARETYDPDGTGLRQIAQAAWGCLALLAYELRGVGTDDRPQAPTQVPTQAPSEEALPFPAPSAAAVEEGMRASLMTKEAEDLRAECDRLKQAYARAIEDYVHKAYHAQQVRTMQNEVDRLRRWVDKFKDVEAQYADKQKAQEEEISRLRGVVSHLDKNLQDARDRGDTHFKRVLELAGEKDHMAPVVQAAVDWDGSDHPHYQDPGLNALVKAVRKYEGGT